MYRKNIQYLDRYIHPYIVLCQKVADHSIGILVLCLGIDLSSLTCFIHIWDLSSCVMLILTPYVILFY